MPGGQAGDAHQMHIIFNGHFGGFFRGLEHGADIHIKAKIRICRCHHFDPAVMAVLAHFGQQDPRPSAFLVGKILAAFSKGFDHG